MARLNIKHNLSDVELEDALEKALKGLRRYAEPDRELPDNLANVIKDDANAIFDKVVQNMLAEIQVVLHKK